MMAQRAKTCAEHSMRLVSWLCLDLLLAVSAFAQHYSVLPVPNSPHGIYQLMQDSHSRLWLGTIDNVYAFDGVHFYSLRPYGFPRETPNAFSEDSDGGIWIGTQGTTVNGGTTHGSLYRYRAGQVEKMLSGDVLGVAAIAPGVVVASMGTEASRPVYGDLYRLRRQGKQWKAELLFPKAANHLTVDHHGMLLFPCPGGWCEIAGSRLAGPLPAAADIQHHEGDPAAERIVRDKFGCVWSRSEAERGGSYQCPGDAHPTVLPYEISQGDSSAHLEEGADASILMLVPLLLGRPGHFNDLRGSPDIPKDLDNALLARDGTIWLGTDSGLLRMTYPFRLEHWGAPEGLVGYRSFLRSIDGTIYSADSGLVVKLQPDRQKWIPVSGIVRSRAIRDIMKLPDGRMIVTGDDGTGVYGSDGRRLANSTTGGSRLAQTRDGELWLAGHNGVEQFVIRGDIIVFKSQSLPRETVFDMEYDQARDVLWACNEGGLLYQTRGVWNSITRKDGLLDHTCDSLDIAPNGDLWVAYRDSAYAVISNPLSGHPQIHNVTGDLDKLIGSNSSEFVHTDQEARIWRASRGTIAAATPAGAMAGKWIRFGHDDGMGHLPFPTDYLADRDGSIWFLTDTGITHFSPPRDFLTNFPSPPLFLGGVSIGDAAPVLEDAVTNIPRSRAVVVYLGSLQFDRRSALHFSYRLLPSQTSWISTDSAELHLGMLRWGGHLLQVRAQLGVGPWSPVVEQTLTVPRPVWLAWPSLGGYLMAVGTLAFAGRKWSRGRRERLKKLFPDLAEWRLAALSPELQQLDGAMLDERFEVGRVLARGGFAVVTEGRDLQQDGLRCAIKIFRQDLGDGDGIARRFRHEVRVLEQVRHPNIVRIYGSGTSPLGALYLVMEFIEGCTLRELLNSGSPTAEKVGSYLLQIGDALDHIHRLGICHRDLKPENLMIREDEVILIDFSIAIIKDPDRTVHGLSRAAGTICYMAPEQVIGYANPATDIYSLAKVTIEMLTGKRPSDLFPNASMDLPDRVRSKLGDLQPRLSTESLELLASALEFDPKNRPNQAKAFAVQIASDLRTTA